MSEPAEQVPVVEPPSAEVPVPVAPGNDEAPNPAAGETMSKRQRKRLEKRERDAQFRAEKRKKERERRKVSGKANLCILENSNGVKVEVHRKALKSNLMANSANKLRILIDCSFENLMSDHDIHHLCKQLSYCYAANRRMKAPLQFYMTSCTNKTRDLLAKSGLLNWDLNLHEKYFLDIFDQEPRQNLVYLTSDSPNELTEFDESKVYIIGGLVDHNHHKSLCYDLAVKNGLDHCRLPISKFMSMKTRQVLTVNQVFQIICKYMDCKDWKQAFVDILPKRKGAEIKDEDSGASKDKTGCQATSEPKDEEQTSPPPSKVAKAEPAPEQVPDPVQPQELQK